MSYKYTKGSQVIGDLKAADDAQRNTVIDFGEDQIQLQTSGSTRLKVDNQGVEITGSIYVATGGTIRIGSSSINQNELSRVSLSENVNSNSNAFLLLDSSGGFTIEDSDNTSASMVFSNPNVSNNASLKIRKTLSDEDSIQLHASSGLSLDGGSTFITSAEINVLDSVTAGTAAASKAVVADSNINITGINTGSFGKIITSKLSSSSGTMELQTGDSTRLKVENTQIITTVPIHISGSLTEGLRIAKGNSDYREIQFETDGVDTAFIQVDASEGLVIGCQSDNDEIIFQTKASGQSISEVVRMTSAGRVGIGTNSPDYTLDVAGNIGVDDRIYHNGDDDTFIGLADDVITLKAGGKSMFKASASVGSIFVNNGGHDIDFVVRNAVTGTLLHTDAANSRVGIGTDSPDYTLDVAGDIGIDQFIYHNGDADTLIKFDDNTIILKAGGKSFIKAEKKGSTPHEVTINDGSNNIDFSVRGNGSNQGNPGMFFDASTNRVGINGVGSPSWELDVAGDIGLAEYIYHRTDTDTYIRFQDNDVRIATAGGERLTVDSNGKVGIGTTTPKIKLDVHHDPTSLANDTGGGEVVKFGSGTLTAGKLYYLSGSTWTETDADGVLNGADQLLGIALGSSPTSNGVLLRGFFDAHSYLSNFSAGKAVYVSTTAAGMDTTRPTGGGDYVRIVGYCTTTANVIYFNPSTDWVEL